ncbi:MAG: hypothetical protein IPI34_13640 [bacterium]|nr:hypothetical protein [bacterium]
MTTWIKRLLLGLGVLVAAAATVAALQLGPYWRRVEAVPADPGAGFHADYFLYLSPLALDLARAGQPVVLLVQPNNSGRTSDDPAVHRKDAWWTGFGRHGLADDLGTALLVPAFVRPATDWHIYTHALDRDVLTTARPDLARIDLQLIAMIDDARARLAARGLPADSTVLIQGFSASGMFANRFTALHPRRVKAVAAGSPGGWPIAPVRELAGESLPYPAGVADLEALVGAPFDHEAWRSVPQLLVLGDLDDNDSLDFTDGWEPDAARQIDRLCGDTPLARWDDSERLYREAGADTRFLLVAGVGHDRRALQQHSTEFFRRVLGDR